MSEQFKEIDIFDLHSLPDQMKETLVEEISEHTLSLMNSERQIVPLTQEKVLAKYIAKVALADRETLAGFAAATRVGQHYQLKMSKVGSLFVMEDFLGNGLGLKLVKSATDEVLKQGDYPFAFCSPSVEKIFHAASYIPAQHIEIPPAQTSYFPSRNSPWIYRDSEGAGLIDARVLG